MELIISNYGIYMYLRFLLSKGAFHLHLFSAVRLSAEVTSEIWTLSPGQSSVQPFSKTCLVV